MAIGQYFIHLSSGTKVKCISESSNAYQMRIESSGKIYAIAKNALIIQYRRHNDMQEFSTVGRREFRRKGTGKRAFLVSESQNGYILCDEFGQNQTTFTDDEMAARWEEVKQEVSEETGEVAEVVTKPVKEKVPKKEVDPNKPKRITYKDLDFKITNSENADEFVGKPEELAEKLGLNFKQFGQKTKKNKETGKYEGKFKEWLIEQQ